MRCVHTSYDSTFILSPHPNEQAEDIERQSIAVPLRQGCRT